MDIFNTMSWGDIVDNEEKGIYINPNVLPIVNPNVNPIVNPIVNPNIGPNVGPNVNPNVGLNVNTKDNNEIKQLNKENKQYPLNSYLYLTDIYYIDLINNNPNMKDYLINNKEYITKILYTQSKIKNYNHNYKIILDLFYKILNIFDKNKFDFITKDNFYSYTFIDLDIIWIEKNIVDLLHKISKDLHYAIIIENKLNKTKSLLIIKSDEQRLKRLRYNYASKRLLPF